VTVPPSVVIVISPLAPPETTAEILVSEIMLKLAALSPPKVTAVAPEKCSPVIVIVAPLAAKAGSKSEITVPRQK
jgi:hypothetical protein